MYGRCLGRIRSGGPRRALSLLAALAALAACITPTGSAAAVQPGTVRTVDLGGGVTMALAWCPPGEFLLGSPAAEQEAALRSLPASLSQAAREKTSVAIRAEGPRHAVKLPRGFWMARTEVTRAQWSRVMGADPSRFSDSGPDAPVESVSWDDCQEFVRRLNASPAGGSGRLFRMPTEAEWEYAARAGSSTAYCFGDDPGLLGDHAWFGQDSGMKTHPVGLKKPNAWGLYDTHGNVWEWCADGYGSYPSASETDPLRPDSGAGRVGRGGGWDDFAGDCRTAYRSYGRPAGFKASPLGFRPVLTEESPGNGKTKETKEKR